MKELILRIIKESNFDLKIINYNGLDFCFASFKEKDDFYLFLFIDLNKLLEITDNSEDIEFAFNRIVIEIQNKHLSEFKERYLDKNLSFISIINNTGNNDDLFQLRKVEENYFVSKKYLLVYNDEDLYNLKNKIDKVRRQDIISVLNKLTIDNNKLLNKTKGNSWYQLLMRLFIKIPFLNYRILDEDKQSLENLDETIRSSLNEEQKRIFKILDEKFKSDYEITGLDIESYIRDNNILDNGNEDEL